MYERSASWCFHFQMIRRVLYQRQIYGGACDIRGIYSSKGSDTTARYCLWILQWRFYVDCKSRSSHLILGKNHNPGSFLIQPSYSDVDADRLIFLSKVIGNKIGETVYIMYSCSIQNYSRRFINCQNICIFIQYPEKEKLRKLEFSLSQ